MESVHQSADNNLSKIVNTVEVKNIASGETKHCSISQVEGSSEGGQTVMTQVVPENMASGPLVYRQDVVSCTKYEGIFGVVMEVAGDSDSDGSITDDSDSEDENDGDIGAHNCGDNGVGDNTNRDDETDSLPEGQVRIMWTDGSERTDNISEITVVDRGFLHGDIVASASNPTGQLGLVVDVSITVDLLAANGEVIKDVSTRDLKRIQEFTVGDYVVCGPWLGRVDDVFDNVTILFDDGSICKVTKADPLRLQPVSKLVTDDSNCPYYPGQRIRAVSSSVFKSCKWLTGLWKPSRLEGTVIKVQTASVVVYWIASAYLGVGTNASTVPSEEQNPKDLTLLDCFSYANWQLGDWCLLPSSSSADGAWRSTENDLVQDSEVKHTSQLIGVHSDININSCPENSGQDIHTTDMVRQGCQSVFPTDTATYDMDEKVENDSHDLQLLSEAIASSSNRNASLHASKCNDSMDIDKTVKTDETSVSETDSRLPGGSSGSSLSSVAKEVVHETWPSYRRKLRKVLFRRDKKSRKRDETFERALFIIKTATKVDVVWQNGNKEFGLEARSLVPIHTPNDHEFFPEQYVVEKASDESEVLSETKRVGIVRSLNAKERTVCVRWFKPISRPEDAREFDCEEVVSVYELDEHPDYDYCYGDVVVRLSPVPVAGDTINLDNGKESSMMKSESDPSAKQSNIDHGEQLSNDEACEDFTCLSWVGNIIGLQDGDIEVTWADGMISKVGPQAIYVVGRDDDGDSFGGGSEVSDDGASWETVDENDMHTFVNTEMEADIANLGDSAPAVDNDVSDPSGDSSIGKNGPLSMPLAALGFVTRIATGLFSRSRRSSDSDHLVANETEPQESIEYSDKEGSSEELGHLNPDTLDDHQSQGTLGTADSHLCERGDTELTSGTDADSTILIEMNIGGMDDQNRYVFKHFDITETPLDHYYLSTGAQSGSGKKWVKKVQQEWTILEKNLPDAIFVRVFEDRMDLLRAVIIGASGTPYQDGLFFFDFHLPPEYPQVPPSAYYHSGGLRVNPNLYVDGKVCLSLLNTWTGKGNEVWDPSSSSILQVLVSLQGLVLNSKPYFNEAGYEKQIGTIEGEKNSLPYNENTYLLNLKSMIYLLRRPPMNFEGFVKDHFQRRGHFVLKACETYMGECTIGSLTRDACMTEKSKEHPCSVGFKLMLAKILPRLISAFKEVGVDCQQFEYLQNSEHLARV